MLPGMVTGWPSGSQRAASNPAERLLSQAVGWWDAAAYRDGDRLLRNRGVAGELLDLQLGSSDRVATTNDPLFLAPEDTGYVYTTGVLLNFLSVQNSEIAWSSGNYEIILDLHNTAPTIDNRYPFYSGAFNTSGGGGIDWRQTSNGFIRAYWRSSNVENVSSPVAYPSSVYDGPVRLRMVLTLDNGSSGHEVSWFTAPLGSTSWTQFGTTFVGVGTTTVDTPSFTNLGLMAIPTTGGGAVTAKFYGATIAIDGTTVLDVDCDAITDGSATSFQAVTGQTVTIGRSATGRKTVAVPRRNGGGRSLFLLGTDDYFECVGGWQHQLLNFDAGDSFTVLAVVRQWATPANNGRHVNKRNASTNVGYDLFNNGTNTNIRAFISDGTNSAQRTGLSSFTLGSPELLGLVVNGVANTFATFVNSSLSATTSTLSVGLLANGAALTIGRFAGSVNYADMEFTSAAIFRRALTPDEIRTITNYYQNRGY
jgi:hypothetical protein